MEQVTEYTSSFHRYEDMPAKERLLYWGSYLTNLISFQISNTKLTSEQQSGLTAEIQRVRHNISILRHEPNTRTHRSGV
jgi:hypothetical protein